MFLQYDHIEPYTDDGPTILANLQRLCGPHNRARGGSGQVPQKVWYGAQPAGAGSA